MTRFTPQDIMLPATPRKLLRKPHLYYCPITKGSSSFTKHLLLTQNRATRIIFDITDFRNLSAGMCKQLQGDIGC